MRAPTFGLAALAAVICLAPTAYGAGQVTAATVIQVRVDAGGTGMVIFNKPIGGTPATCAISFYNNALAFNANAAGGRAILALALTAKATGQLINAAYGSGVCTAYGVVEDWFYGQ